ncbi:MAG: ABC transporter ATP-binding protein [Chloroflexi bacterium]|nr:ABC transporter ATP-binding protein [Chloroflexota bacterium]MBV9896709.1 ABC transporter ATP-binding protein [Chloroflexota bacterium]
MAARPPRGSPRPRLDFAVLMRALRYATKHRKIAVLAYGSLLIATIAQLIVPQLVRIIIDSVVGGVQLQSNADSVKAALVGAMIAIVVFSLVRALFAYGQQYNAERISQNIAFDLRNELFAKIQRVSFSYLDRTQTGQLMIRATDDVEKVRLFIGQGLVMALQSFLLLTATLVVMWFSNAGLTLVVLPILPIAFVVFFWFGGLAQPLFMSVQIRISALNTVLQENVAGLKVVRAFGREPHEQARFDASAEALLEQQLKVSRTFSFLFPVVFLIASLGQAAVLYFGGRQIIGGTLTVGEWQKFSLYLGYLFMPMGQLGFIINLMSQASASAERIFEILDTQNEIANKPDAIGLPEVQGRVQFDKVTFRYFKGGEPVLSDVSFEVEPGQTLALLGATGSGKSTIINLLPRFYDVSAGRVLVDGRDVRDVRFEDLRSHIGIVLQETTLFSGTIRENIAYGRPDATLEDVVSAARAAAAHNFIMDFPLGYETPVGERGSTLSGGQKQRIAIARALLTDPRILILDDSTSSVDVATEYQIQQALEKLMVGRTSFVIAQRISTVRNADQILVLDKGAVAARGSHEELLESSEIYADIYSSQLLDDAPTRAPSAAPVDGVAARNGAASAFARAGGSRP